MRFIRTATPPVLGPFAGLLDDFNRANGAVGANYTADPLNEAIPGMSIIGNLLYSPNNDNASAWATAFAADQDVTLDVSTWDGTANFRGVSLLARLLTPGTATVSGYYAKVQPSSASRTGHSWEISRVDNGTPTALKIVDGPAPAAGDQLWFKLRGSTLTFYHRASGDGFFTPVVTVTDTTYNSTGYVGVRSFNSTHRFDNLAAGAASPIDIRVASSGDNIGSLTWTIPKPSVVQSGDVVYISINTGRGFTAWTPPTGWTQIASAGDGNNREIYIFRRVLDGSEGASFAFVGDGGTPFGTWTLTALTGVDTTTPEDVAAGTNNGPAASTTATTTAQTPVATAAMLLGYFAGRGTVPTAGTPSDLATELIEERSVLTAMATYVALKPSRNASTSISVTMTSSLSWASIQIALRPASAGGSTVTDAGTVVVTATPTGVEVVVDAGAAVSTLSFAAAETVLDQATVTETVTPTAAETVLDQATAGATATPAAAAEVIVDQSADLATFTPTGSGNIVNPGADAGTVVITFSPTASELLIEAATASATATPSAQETIIEPAATAQATVALAGTDAPADTATATATFTGTSTSATGDQGTLQTSAGLTGGEQTQETATLPLSVLLTGAETIRDAGAGTATATQTGAGTILLGDAGTVTLTITGSGVEQTFTYRPLWGAAAAEVVKVPAAGADVVRTAGARAKLVKG